MKLFSSAWFLLAWPVGIAFGTIQLWWLGGSVARLRQIRLKQHEVTCGSLEGKKCIISTHCIATRG